MKLADINSKTIQKVSNSEISNLHRRIHQLFVLAKKRKSTKKEYILFLENVHEILSNEMSRRKMSHNSPLTIIATLKFLYR